MNVAKPAAVSAGAIALMLLAAAWAWARAPEVLPVHWGATGVADRWAPRAFALLVHPAAAALMTALFAGLPAIMPRNGRLERSARAYALVWVGGVLLIALVQGVAVASATGLPVDVARVVGAGTGLLIVLLGDLMGKVRYNYVFGVRTPWTLADERVWDRTHRALGPWFMAWGLVVAAASLGLGAPGLAATAAAGGALVLVGALTCSYLIARRLGVA